MTAAPAPERARAGAASDTATAVSPTVRQTARRALPWLLLAAIAVAVAGFGVLLTGGRVDQGTPLDAANPAPGGAKAVAQVIRSHGVDVRSVATLRDAREAATSGATVLVYDQKGDLSGTRYRELAGDGRTLVLVEPDFRTLETVAPGVKAAGEPGGPVYAGCDLPAARRAERIDPRPVSDQAVGYPGTFTVSGEAVACFSDGDERASLVRTTFGGSSVYLLGSSSVLTNEGVDRLGNAALALNLLGSDRTLVWYLPSVDDRPVTGPPDIGALTPGWVTPVMLLLVVVFVAAAVWRGRRFGPLVVENLPVVVRAGETREGRARLYQRSSARGRAADALRIGAIGRLATTVGLPTTATADEVADAVAAVTGRDRGAVHDLVLIRIPRTDRELIALSDELAELERAARSAVSPASGPTGRMDV